MLLAIGGAVVFGGLPLWIFVAAVMLSLALLVIATMRPEAQFFIPSYLRGQGDLSARPIALSFDDGPTEGTEAVLDILKTKGVPATFFVVGKKAEQRADLLQRMHAEGHLIGNHSYNHGFFFDLNSKAAILEEIEQTNRIVASTTGLIPRWFRPPYGVTNPNLAWAIRKANMVSVAWSLRSFDTQYRNPLALRRRIVSALRPGDILLLHDPMPICAEVLAELIDESREKGFTFVKLDQMIPTHAYQSESLD